MPRKKIVIDPKRCTGCRLCEMVCAVKHTGKSNPARSRIRVIKWEDKGICAPTLCRQCRNAPCKAACPVEAIDVDPALAVVTIDPEACIGCQECVAACPFGVMGFDEDDQIAFKCDLCGGDPQCARFCDIQAVAFTDAGKHEYRRRRASAAKENKVPNGQRKSSG